MDSSRVGEHNCLWLLPDVGTLKLENNWDSSKQAGTGIGGAGGGDGEECEQGHRSGSLKETLSLLGWLGG